MEDHEPWFSLRLTAPGSHVTQEYLDRVTQAVNHALDVTYREEVELARAELRDAFIDWVTYGTAVDTDSILARYQARIREHWT